MTIIFDTSKWWQYSEQKPFKVYCFYLKFIELKAKKLRAPCGWKLNCCEHLQRLDLFELRECSIGGLPECPAFLSEYFPCCCRHRQKWVGCGLLLCNASGLRSVSLVAEEQMPGLNARQQILGTPPKLSGKASWLLRCSLARV